MADVDPFDLRAEAERENDKRHIRAVNRQDQEADWAWIMSGPKGRRLIHQVLARCGVYQSSFDTNGSAMSFKEGRRDVGLWIIGMCEAHAPESYLEMMKEARDEHG